VLILGSPNAQVFIIPQQTAFTSQFAQPYQELQLKEQLFAVGQEEV
jgi:hypothetical protein